jgi:hypothetical protein
MDIDPVITKLLARAYVKNLAEMICSVQPMDSISDPTRGNENIFTIRYWCHKYEQKQYMTWDDDGGYTTNG